MSLMWNSYYKGFVALKVLSSRNSKGSYVTNNRNMLCWFILEFQFLVLSRTAKGSVYRAVWLFENFWKFYLETFFLKCIVFGVLHISDNDTIVTITKPEEIISEFDVLQW